MAAIFFFLVFLLTLSPPFFEQQTNIIVEANYELIKGLCHFAPTPSLCLECAQSDPNAPKTDQYGIATILVGCLDKHSSILESNISSLATKTHNNGLKIACKDCVHQNLVAAKKALSDATVYLTKKHDCEGAIHQIKVALDNMLACGKKLKSFEVDIGKDVLSKIKFYEQLSDAAMRIIEHIIL